MRYSPFRRSPLPKELLARLAWNKHAATVRSEPGSNPSNIIDSFNPILLARFLSYFSYMLFLKIKNPKMDFSKKKFLALQENTYVCRQKKNESGDDLLSRPVGKYHRREKLNGRVRYGNGCDLFTMITR